MFKKFLGVALAATLMLGGTALAGTNYVVDSNDSAATIDLGTIVDAGTGGIRVTANGVPVTTAPDFNTIAAGEAVYLTNTQTAAQTPNAGVFAANAATGMSVASGATLVIGYAPEVLVPGSSTLEAAIAGVGLTVANGFSSAGTFIIGSVTLPTDQINTVSVTAGDFVLTGGTASVYGPTAGDATIAVLGTGDVGGAFRVSGGNHSFVGGAAGGTVITAKKFDFTGGSTVYTNTNLTSLADTTNTGTVFGVKDAYVALGTGTVLNIAATTTALDKSIYIGANGYLDITSAAAMTITGAAGQTFTLDKGGVLGLETADLTLATMDGLTTIDGTVIIGGAATGAATANSLTAAGNVTVGVNSKVQFNAAMSQSIAENAAALTGTPVNLLTAGGVINYTGTAANTVNSTLGTYTVTYDGATGVAQNLQLTDATDVVDFTTDVAGANGWSQYQANAAGMYGSYAASGLTLEAFKVAAAAAQDVPTVLHASYAGAYAPSRAVADAANQTGRFNEAFLQAYNSGYGSPFNFDLDNLGSMSQNYVVDRGMIQSYTGANVVNVVDTNQSTGYQAIGSLNNHFKDVRNDWNQARNAVNGNDALAAAIMDCNYKNRVWVGGFGMWEDGDTRGGIDGYKYDSYGFMLGYDRVAGPVVFGASFGYQTGDYEDKTMTWNDSDIDSYSFNLYATYNHCSGFFFSLLGGYTYSDNNIKEGTGGTRWEEDYHTNTWYAEAKVGYDIRPVQNFRITPSIGLGYIHSKASDHNRRENGVGMDTIRYGSMKTDTAFLPVELEMAYDICTASGVFTMSANGGYTYNFDDDPVDGNVFINGMTNSATYSAIGRSRGHSMWNVGAGLKYSAARWEAGAKYDYFSKSDADAHRVFGYVGFKF